MAKYLYGAAVQGIQNFIFQTNKLQEIVGASELVEEICTTFFEQEMGKSNFKEGNLILGAAGNIKYIFEDREKCQEFVKKFPKKVMEMAPGITISQAVVEYKENGLNQALQELEDKLREQRNKVSVPFEMAFMGTSRNRRTGGVAFEKHPVEKEDEIVDEATYKKIKAKNSRTLFEDISGIKDFKTEELLFNTDDLKGSWIAVIHADGNGLGTIIQNLNNSFEGKNDEEVKNGFKSFSKALDKATKVAAQEAFKSAKIEKQKGIYPIRPIVLGGDDLTVIIRADLAFEFTRVFLSEFEQSSKKELAFLVTDFGINQFSKGITACAGIAYVKKSYPFHYAVDLAKKLCSDAKNFVKGKAKYYNKDQHPDINGLIPKSALAFFKVQDSFIEESLMDMKIRTLKVSDTLSFDYGPYLIDENQDKFASVGELTKMLDVLKKYGENADKGETNGISKLRKWITEVYRDKSTADFMLDRMKVINNKFYEEMDMDAERRKNKSIIYDVIQLNSLKN